jgi:prepilin-type N-terminal cleavage/methylation domain-containing protein
MTRRPHQTGFTRRGGFTLLEVVLALSIVSVVSGMMYWFFWDAMTTTEQESSKARDVQLVRVVLDRLIQEIRQASGFVPAYGPGLIGYQHEISVNTVVLPDKRLMYPRSIKDEQRVGQFDVEEVHYYIGWDEDHPDENGDPIPLGLVRRVRKTLLQEVVLQTDKQADTGNQEETVAVKEELYAPEIKFIEFKYFDGATWWKDWEITQGNGLPQIVRITVGFKPVMPRDEETNLIKDDFLRDESELVPLAPDRFAVFVRLTQADTFFGSRLSREAAAFSTSTEETGF